MINYIDEDRIHKLSEGDIDIPLYQKIIKLQEETGELAQAFLEFDNSKNVSKSAKFKGKENPGYDVLEEACDCINVAMDIINKITMDSDDGDLSHYTRDLFQRKLDKWEAKQQKYKNKG